MKQSKTSRFSVENKDKEGCTECLETSVSPSAGSQKPRAGKYFVPIFKGSLVDGREEGRTLLAGKRLALTGMN